MNPSTARKSPSTAHGKGPRGKPLTPRALKIVSKLRGKLLETMPPESLPLKHPLSDFVQIYDKTLALWTFCASQKNRTGLLQSESAWRKCFPFNQSINQSVRSKVWREANSTFSFHLCYLSQAHGGNLQNLASPVHLSHSIQVPLAAWAELLNNQRGWTRPVQGLLHLWCRQLRLRQLRQPRILAAASGLMTEKMPSFNMFQQIIT